MGEFSGVDFDQAGSDAVAGESSGGDVAAQGAGGDIYAVGGFREGDQVLPRAPPVRAATMVDADAVEGAPVIMTPPMGCSGIR